MGGCSDEARILIGLGAFGVALIWIGVAVTWTAARRVLRASRAALLEITEWRDAGLSPVERARLRFPGRLPRA